VRRVSICCRFLRACGRAQSAGTYVPSR
jgi:hypothetical protein